MLATIIIDTACIVRKALSLTPHSTQYRSFRRRSSQPIAWLILTNKTVQEIQTNSIQIRKSKQPKIPQNKTTLVQLPLTTLGQETRWAYSTTPPSPHGAYVKQCLWNDGASVRLSVCLSRRLTAATTCGGFAAERPAGRICRSIAGGCAQQQMRAVPCWQPT